jgi:large subunit ribosomal protein L23
MPTLYTVIRRPLITEKGMTVKETQNTLVFEVDLKATKIEVKQAVETLFKVKDAGYRPDWKKAYVRLAADQKMPDYLNSI